MNKALIWWNSILSILLVCLYFWMLFTNGELPAIKDRIFDLEMDNYAINYYLNHTEKK